MGFKRAILRNMVETVPLLIGLMGTVLKKYG